VVLKRAVGWQRGRDLAFLPELSQVKGILLDRYIPRPFFRIEKPRDDVLQFVADISRHLLEYAKSSADKTGAIQAEFLHEMENDPIGIQEAIKDYSYVFAATCQQAQGKPIIRAKSEGVSSGTSLPAYDTVIVDEAARTSPRDMLIPMAQARKRIILVGDHRQLPHLIDMEVAKAMESEKSDLAGSTRDWENEFYNKSMFKYLFARLAKLEQKDGICRRVTLDQQYRMHPLLGNFVSDHFYRDHKEAFGSPLPAEHFTHKLQGTDGKPAAWMDVPSGEYEGEERVGTSRSRTAEASQIAKQLKAWIDSLEGQGLSFGIISFYKAQVNAVRAALAEYGVTTRTADGALEIAEKYAFFPSEDGKPPEKRLRIGTVDAFQGMEFDVVFLSMVRSRERLPKPAKDFEDREKDKRRYFGHLISPNRLCVSMSRQKRLLVVAGDSAMLDHELAWEAVPALVDFHALCHRGEGAIL